MSNIFVYTMFAHTCVRFSLVFTNFDSKLFLNFTSIQSRQALQVTKQLRITLVEFTKEIDFSRISFDIAHIHLTPSSPVT